MKQYEYYASVSDPSVELFAPGREPSLVALAAKIDFRKRLVIFPFLGISFDDVLKIARAIENMESYERS